MASVSQNKLEPLTPQARLATESNLQIRANTTTAATWPILLTGRLPTIARNGTVPLLRYFIIISIFIIRNTEGFGITITAGLLASE